MRRSSARDAISAPTEDNLTDQFDGNVVVTSRDRTKAVYSLTRRSQQLPLRLRYPAIAIIMEHFGVLFDIHNAKNDA